MSTVLIKNAKIVNEGKVFEGDVLIENEFIVEIAESISAKSASCKIIDAEGSYLIPGAIDDQVHFREPGLTHKGDIASESKAAVAGGLTSIIEQGFRNVQSLNRRKNNESLESALSSPSRESSLNLQSSSHSVAHSHESSISSMQNVSRNQDSSQEIFSDQQPQDFSQGLTQHQTQLVKNSHQDDWDVAATRMINFLLTGTALGIMALLWQKLIS